MTRFREEGQGEGQNDFCFLQLLQLEVVNMPRCQMLGSHVLYLIFNILKYHKITIHKILCYITNIQHTVSTLRTYSTHGHTR